LAREPAGPPLQPPRLKSALKTVQREVEAQRWISPSLELLLPEAEAPKLGKQVLWAARQDCSATIQRTAVGSSAWP